MFWEKSYGNVGRTSMSHTAVSSVRAVSVTGQPKCLEIQRKGHILHILLILIRIQCDF